MILTAADFPLWAGAEGGLWAHDGRFIMACPFYELAQDLAIRLNRDHFATAPVPIVAEGVRKAVGWGAP